MAQLAAFSRSEKIKQEGIKVVAASVDPEDVVKKVMEENKVTFPVGHSLDPVKISEITGAMYSPDPGRHERPYLHSTNFLLQPDGKVNVSCYSSGPIGRFIWQDVVQAVQFRKKMMAQQG